MITNSNDDWRIEVHSQLNTSLLFQELQNKSPRETGGDHVISLIHDAVFYAYQRTKTIIKHMGEYTLHDGDHLFRVLRLMERLIPENVLVKLSAPELMLLILTAFFHDIGMAPSQKEVEAWLTFWDLEDPAGVKNSDEYKAFNKYCHGYPHMLEDIDELSQTGQHTKAQLIKSHLISEFIRSTHADRARIIIEEDWSGKIVYKGRDITPEFAQLCFSHNENALSLIDMDSAFMCVNSYVCLPFIGIILRLADILDFDSKRTPEVLFSHLFIRNPVSLSEWNKHRSIDAWNISNNIIQFHARCSHPAIEHSIRSFCDMIDRELSAANGILNKVDSSFPSHYKITLPLSVDRSKIGPIRKIKTYKPVYNYHDTSFTLNKRQVIDLLMGTKLYAQPELALRELIQNSIDACLLRQAMSKKWNIPHDPEITIKFSKKDNKDYLEVSDNGIGMDLDIINRFYSSVGTSYYKSPQFYELKASINIDFKPISRFGIGILSYFMVSDDLKVSTKRLIGPYKSSDALEIILEGHDSIFLIQDGKRVEPGTTTELLLRKEHPWQHYSDQEITDAIVKLIPHPPFPIEIVTGNKKHVHTRDCFKNLNINELKDNRWKPDSNISEIDFDIIENEFGIIGKGLAGLISQDGKFLNKIARSTRTITVEGEDYELERNIVYRENEIRNTSQSIEVSEDGTTQLKENDISVASSKAILSQHGIEIPFNLFPDFSSGRQQKVKLSWPMPVLLIFDIVGKHDLNLNTARTEILFDDKWIEFEINLAFLVLSSIKATINNGRIWNELKEILRIRNTNMAFAFAMDQLDHSN